MSPPSPYDDMVVKRDSDKISSPNQSFRFRDILVRRSGVATRVVVRNDYGYCS